MKTNKKIIIAQIIFLAIVGIVLFVLYPKADVSLEGNAVKINAGNANVIIISENPDFSNPRFIEVGKEETVVNLEAGTYYWKASNNYIEGLKKSFTIDSEVGMGIKEYGEGSELENIGNVKINVTKNKEGIMVGHIILEPDESEEIENENEEYVGRQEE